MVINNLSKEEFIDGPNTYDKLLEVLQETQYKAHRDYSGMTLAQAKEVQAIEDYDDAFWQMWEIAVVKIRAELLRRYPKEAFRIDCSCIERSAKTYTFLVEGNFIA